MAQPRGSRKPSGVVAFLLTDIEGSTRLWQEHRAAMPAVIARHDEILRSGIQSNRGRVLTERGEGDSFFAVFARATDAALAARDLQLALHAETWPDGIQISVRMAINTGEAGGDYRGMTANRSARIRQLARGGEVLMSQTTHGLVADEGLAGISFSDLGLKNLKDVERPEHVFRMRIAGLPEPVEVPAPAPARGNRVVALARRRPRLAAAGLAAVLAVVVAATLLGSSLVRSPSSPAAAGSAVHNSSGGLPAHLTIRTVAGQGDQGYALGDTSALDAKLDHPEGLAVDAQGDLYIADTGNNLVRELVHGKLIDVAGGGSDTNAAGQPGTAIRLNHPTGLFADLVTGDLYIADTGDNRVLKLDANHVVTLVTGTGVAGHSGNGVLGVDAQLDAPTAVVYGPLSTVPGTYSGDSHAQDNDLLIADSGNHVLRVDNTSTSADITDLIEGQQPFAPPAAVLPFPELHLGGLPSLAIAPSGNYYIADSGGSLIYVARPTCPGYPCAPSIIAGTGAAGDSGEGGRADQAELDLPEGLAVADGRLYICDSGNSAIRVVDPNTGRISTLAGQLGDVGFGGDNGRPELALLANPAAIAVAPDGAIFIADTGNNRIREIAPAA